MQDIYNISKILSSLLFYYIPVTKHTLAFLLNILKYFTKVDIVEGVPDLVLHILDHAADVHDVRRDVTHR